MTPTLTEPASGPRQEEFQHGAHEEELYQVLCIFRAFVLELVEKSSSLLHWSSNCFLGYALANAIPHGVADTDFTAFISLPGG